MVERWRETVAEINLGHLEHNLKLLKSLTPANQFFCPMIKANAYGHGDVAVSAVIEKNDISAAGVVLVEEGAKLRESGFQRPILVFGEFNEISAPEVVKYNLTPVFSSAHHLRVFEKAGVPHDFKIHLKFNTGMGRLGFEVEEAAELSKVFKNQSHYSVEGLCTHLVSGDDSGKSGGRTEEQMKLFYEKVVPAFQNPKIKTHLMNSSACVSKIDSKGGARVGLALYGINPPTYKNINLDLRPVMSLRTHLCAIRKVKKGQTVSYSGTWTAKRDSVIGTVPLGYADGYPRAFSNKGKMLIQSQVVPVVGIVCMDYTMLDLTDLKSVHLGEEVVVLGEQRGAHITAGELATMIDSIPYEIVTRIGSRVPRVYLRK